MTACHLEAQSLVDPFLVEHLDEDWAVPCADFIPAERGGCGGQAHADWIAWWVACCPERKPATWCQRCLSIVLAAGFVGCGYCHAEYAPPRTAFRLIEPLNRRTT